MIIVEGVGDLVLRNGKRIICIKLRRSDESGLEYAIDSADYLPPKWEVPAPLPEGVNGGAGAAGGAMPAGANNGIPGFGTPAQMQAMPYGAGGGQAQGHPGQYDVQIGQSQVIVPQYNNGAAGQNINVGYQPGAAANFDYSNMQPISNNGAGTQQPNPYLRQYGYGSGFTDVSNSNISIELGTDSDVSNLENLWDDLSKKYSADLNRYEPFFSVDAPADGQGKELFHLRVGPIKSLEEGDKTCGILGRNGVFCSVVRTQ